MFPKMRLPQIHSHTQKNPATFILKHFTDPFFVRVRRFSFIGNIATCIEVFHFRREISEENCRRKFSSTGIMVNIAHTSTKNSKEVKGKFALLIVRKQPITILRNN
jgi:hypothetical protein